MSGTPTQQDGAKIRRLRHRLGISRVDFAARVGIKPGSLSNIELGNKSARLDVLVRIADELGVDLLKVVRRGTLLHQSLTRSGNGNGDDGRAA